MYKSHSEVQGVRASTCGFEVAYNLVRNTNLVLWFFLVRKDQCAVDFWSFLRRKVRIHIFGVLRCHYLLLEEVENLNVPWLNDSYSWHVQGASYICLGWVNNCRSFLRSLAASCVIATTESGGRGSMCSGERWTIKRVTWRLGVPLNIYQRWWDADNWCYLRWSFLGLTP